MQKRNPGAQTKSQGFLYQVSLQCDVFLHELVPGPRYQLLLSMWEPQNTSP